MRRDEASRDHATRACFSLIKEPAPASSWTTAAAFSPPANVQRASIKPVSAFTVPVSPTSAASNSPNLTIVQTAFEPDRRDGDAPATSFAPWPGSLPSPQRLRHVSEHLPATLPAPVFPTGDGAVPSQLQSTCAEAEDCNSLSILQKTQGLNKARSVGNGTHMRRFVATVSTLRPTEGARIASVSIKNVSLHQFHRRLTLSFRRIQRIRI